MKYVSSLSVVALVYSSVTLHADVVLQGEPGGDGGVVGGDHEQDGSCFRSAYAASSVTDEVAADERKKAKESQAGFADAVDGLDDIVSGMNAFVDDSRAGLDGAEVEPVGGHVQFDVDKFMSLLNGEDLM